MLEILTSDGKIYVPVTAVAYVRATGGAGEFGTEVALLNGTILNAAQSPHEISENADWILSARKMIEA